MAVKVKNPFAGMQGRGAANPKGSSHRVRKQALLRLQASENKLIKEEEEKK